MASLIMSHAAESNNITKDIFAGFGLIVFCPLVLYASGASCGVTVACGNGGIKYDEED